MVLPAFLDPIVTAPRWQQLLLGVLAVLVLCGSVYFLLLSPLESRVEMLTAQHASLQREILQARAAVADLARVRREAAELERRLEAMKDKLPTEKEMPSLFRSLHDAAYQAGLVVSLFRPREPRIKDYYSEIPISLTAEGGYHQVGEFFSRVARLPRVVAIGEIKLTGLARAKEPLRAELTLATYTYRPLGSPPPPKPAGTR